MVAPVVAGGLIAGGSSILGGILGSKSASKANKRNINFQRQENDKNRQMQYDINLYNASVQREVNHYNRQHQAEINRQNVALARDLNQQQQHNYLVARDDSFKRIQRTVADARAAGINPLTALGATGGGGFAPAPPALVSPQLQASVDQAHRAEATFTVAPRVEVDTSFGDAIADAGAALGAAYANQPDPEMEALRKQVMRAQLEEIQRNTEALHDRSFGYSIPHAAQYSGVDYGTVRQVNDPVGYSANPDPLPHRVASGSNLIIGGRRVSHDPAFSNTEDIETRYGDVGGAIYGGVVALADGFETIRDAYRQRWPRRPVPRPDRNSPRPPRQHPLLAR